MDLIDRQAAIDIVRGYEERLNDYIDAPNDSEVYAFARGLILSIKRNICAAPPAQPEIIRCKDCKHYYYADNRIPQEQRYVCDLDSDRWNPDDYCSYAERRING